MSKYISLSKGYDVLFLGPVDGSGLQLQMPVVEKAWTFRDDYAFFLYTQQWRTLVISE